MKSKDTLPYQKVLLKLSGESLQGENSSIDPDSFAHVSKQIREIHSLGIKLSIVVGGGNIIRGRSLPTQGGRIERSTADYMGMLGTVINAIALQNTLESMGVPTRVLSAIRLDTIAEPYIRSKAMRHLEKDRVVIFAAGTGSPYFSTDTAAVLRALEVKADILLKATKVNGVYDSDPITHHDAKKFEILTYLDVLKKKLKVIDSTAVSLCMDNSLPIIVFNLWQKNALKDIIQGETLGTLITGG
ncbi:UMP kinase [PVC group bacterium (ex Bugula neritina AB1)]|nr:UMP kinase [PVC group bacterium (ex Bugula neritina AB1)]